MKYKFLFLLVLLNVSFDGLAQQDPQYTQYMYNTQVVNPAYVGATENLQFGLLGRTQWVNFEGAPRTGTLTVGSPIGVLNRMGLGLSIVVDEIGPSIESNINVDYGYNLNLNEDVRLSLGLKAGIDFLDVDFARLNPQDAGDIFESNIDRKVQPQIGAGAYLYSDRYYVGLSVPNFLETKHFDDATIARVINNPGSVSNVTTAAERMHFFFIAGYVYDLSENVKFKPATMIKMVTGSPLQVDVSANFMFNDKFVIGGSYRWSAALNAMAGFQITDGMFLGVGYDYQTTEIETFSDGSYEVFLRFDIFKNPERILTPRFF